MASPPIWLRQTGARRGETGTEREKQRVRRKRPESSVKPQREAWGDGGKHNDVISIDSQGKQISTVFYDCYYWTDRKEVGGMFTLNLNSIRRYNAERDLEPEIKLKIKEALWICRCMFSYMEHAGAVNSLRYWYIASVPVHLHLYILATLPLYEIRIFFFSFKKQ